MKTDGSPNPSAADPAKPDPAKTSALAKKLAGATPTPAKGTPAAVPAPAKGMTPAAPAKDEIAPRAASTVATPTGGTIARAPSGKASALGEGAVAPLPPHPDPTAILELRPPLEEFEAYARQRIEACSRLGEEDKAKLYMDALDLGRQLVIETLLDPEGKDDAAPAD